MPIICVLTEIRGPYSGQNPFIKTLVVACGYRLQAAATEANGNHSGHSDVAGTQNNSIISRIKLIVHCIDLFT